VVSEYQRILRENNEDKMNDNHDWKKMYPDPETGSTPVGDGNSPLFWFIAGALSMLGVLGFIAWMGSNLP